MRSLSLDDPEPTKPIRKEDKMFRQLTIAAALAFGLASAAWAETFDVQMLNRGEAGTMVF